MVLLRIRQIFLHGDEEPVECVMGILLMGFGFWLILPMDTFATMTSYRSLAETGIPEPLIGLGVWLLGALRLWLILTNRYRPRQTLGVIIGALWGYNALLALVANPGSLLVPVYLLFLCISGWVVFRLNGKTRV